MTAVDNDRRAGWFEDEWDDPEEVPAVERPPRQSRVLKWFVWMMFVVGVAAILAAGYVGWWYTGKLSPQHGTGEAVEFTINEGDTLDSITDRLVRDGLVADGGVFKWYVENQGGLEIVPGYYQIRSGDQMGSVLARLRTPPDQTTQDVTFPEGLTVAQMGERLAKADPRLNAEAFYAAATSGTIKSKYSPPGQPSLEGLLFPDTYKVSNADNEGQVVERMSALMERVGNQEGLDAKAAELGLTPYQVLTIASIIEREAKVDEDRPKIARVIYNRLALEMNLEIDAVVYYGKGDFEGPFSQLRQIPGPYNSYLNPGLPPTPIANPGRASIRAALNPAPDPPAGDPICQALPDPTVGCQYLYYVLADANGLHAFAATPEQHAINVERASEAGLL